MLSKKPWRPELVLMFFGALFASFCFANILALTLQKAGVAAFKSPDSFANVVLGTMSFQGAAWAFIYIFLRLHKMDWRDAFGFRAGHLGKTIAFAAGVLILALPVLFALQWISLFTLTQIGWPPEKEAAVKLFLAADSAPEKIYFAFFAVVMAPVAEEFIFRGMLYPLFKQTGWPKTAAVGVSLLFALIHFSAPIFLPLFFLALALTWIYEKTDCLLAPVAAHSLFNTLNLALLLAAEKLGKDFPLRP